MNPEGERRAAAEGATPKACPSCGKRYPADALFCSLDGAPLTTSPGAIAAAAATDPYVGREILGHIEIRQLVGIGAMGRVYRAFQRGIDRDVAVKILHRELSANQALVSRFHREAKVASRLAHPNVVHVLLVGQLPDGALYIVMEYLDGMSLQSAMAAAGGAMPLPRALHVALQLCEAAGEAHAQGIVHRDLKPENVMLVRRADDPDFVKVLDFGVARLNWDEPSTATAAGLIFGTARYISPEGAQGERVGPQGDVYSIATMIYQMLSGRTPFDADQAVALLVQQIHDPPPPLKDVERAAYVPEPVASVIMRNLAKKPDERAGDARALSRSLLEAAVSSGLSAQDILARPSLVGGARGSHASVVQMPSMQRTKQLALEPAVAARIEAAVAANGEPAKAKDDGAAAASAERPDSAAQTSERGVHKTDFETPSPEAAEPAPRVPTRTEISDPAALPPTTETVKWASPADLEAKLAAAPRPRVPPSPTQALPSRAQLETTMDEQLVAARAHGPGPHPNPDLRRLQPAPPRTVYVAQSMGTATPAPVSPTAVPSFETVPMSPVSGRLTPSPPSYRPTPPPLTRPPSSVDSTLAGERAPGAVTHAGAIGLVIACFFVGALAMSALVWRAGIVGRSARAVASSSSSAAPAVSLVPAPPVSFMPALPAPSAAPGPAPEPESPAVPPLAATRPSTGGPTLATASRVSLDASSSRPGLGQPVDFVARLAPSSGPAPKIEGEHFHIAGPGLAGGTELPAPDDGSGAYRTTFTFLQAGRFDVQFIARVDGAAATATRVVFVATPAPTPASPHGTPATTQPLPAPGSSAKWL